MSRAHLPHSPTLVLVSSGVSSTMVITSLSFARTTNTVYILKLITSIALDPHFLLSAFIRLRPVRQLGFWFRVNNQDL